VNLVDEDRLVAMKRAGCEFMQFGVEHGSEKVLLLLDKGTSMKHIRQALALVRKVGMNLGIYLITGIPGETWEDVELTAELIRAAKPHDCQISPLALYPGTRMYDDIRAEGRVSREFFRESGDAEIFARQDAHTEKALRFLSHEIEAVKPKARYTPAEFAAQKQWLGYCAVTNLLCGEAAEDMGRLLEAEAEYSEIIRREPGSFWGFMKRALLFEKQGRMKQAKADLEEALALAPGNPEATELAGLWGLRLKKDRTQRPAHGPTAVMKGAEAYLARPKM
jgi:tetratricopeptide (TPR) repeat protein